MTEVSGRRVLLTVGAIVVLVCGYIGYVIGTSHADRAAIRVFGRVTLPMSPLAMSIYGSGLALLVIAILFGAVSLASRYDTAGA